jgi:hypothetical protein
MRRSIPAVPPAEPGTIEIDTYPRPSRASRRGTDIAIGRLQSWFARPGRSAHKEASITVSIHDFMGQHAPSNEPFQGGT